MHASPTLSGVWPVASYRTGLNGIDLGERSGPPATEITHVWHEEHATDDAVQYLATLTSDTPSVAESSATSVASAACR